MKKIVFLIMLVMTAMMGHGQTARQVLDKAAKVVSNRQGITASFTISSVGIGTTSGTISVKGKKFHATTPVATIWFDGKTQWTYMKNNNEVNVSNPSEAELQAINPYNFINLYKSGFTTSMTTAAQKYQIHLVATNKKRNLQEMYITINKSNYVPTQVKMKQRNGWTTINISNFKSTKLSDELFRFKTTDYPHAEIIDLR
jgi:outer membrane lipoprotein-sorting protein